MSLTPDQRSTRAKIAAAARWSAEDGHKNAIRAQQGLRAKFYRETRERFPDLPEDQIERRSEHAYKAHMLRLALKSSKARQARQLQPTSDDPGSP